MNFWIVIYRFSWLTLMALVCIGIVAMFVPQYRQYKEYERREQALEEKIQRERESLTDLKEKQERFESDPRFVEMVAHEIGLAKPDETIFKFAGDDDPAGAKP